MHGRVSLWSVHLWRYAGQMIQASTVHIGGHCRHPRGHAQALSDLIRFASFVYFFRSVFGAWNASALF